MYFYKRMGTLLLKAFLVGLGDAVGEALGNHLDRKLKSKHLAEIEAKKPPKRVRRKKRAPKLTNPRQRG